MKVVLYIFAATCLINALTAADLSAFDTNIDTENLESNFLNFDAPADDGIKELSSNLHFPTRRPTTSSTTRRPHPPPHPPPPPPPFPRPTTTRRPLPPPPPPPPSPVLLKNPQIYNNRAEALAPFAGRLVNLVYNKGERQKTVQKNQILYNIKSTVPKFLEEKSNE